jgi:hypothetical protein
MRSRSARFLPAVALVSIVLAAAGSSPRAASSGESLVVNVPEPYEVGGKVYPAGLLAVRHLGDYSPTTKMDRITADGGCLGIVLAERRPGEEGGLLGKAVVFRRSPRGHLVLVGYTTGEASDGRFYAYRNLDPGGAEISEALVALR